MMTTFSSLADLEGLVDGATVLVGRSPTDKPTPFVKREKGLERNAIVVPFKVFSGAVAASLVTDDTPPRQPNRWYRQGIWIYYPTHIDDQQVRFVLFRNGVLSDPPLRTRTRDAWDTRTLTEVDEDTLRTTFGSAQIANLRRLIRQIEADYVQVQERAELSTEIQRLRERLHEIRRMAASA